jgi:hypothetical protein
VNREYLDGVLAAYRASVERAKALQKTQPIWSAERRAALRAADMMVPQVNAVLHGLLPDIRPIEPGYVAKHIANLGLLTRAQALLDTWKAITLQGPDGTEVVPPWLPFSAMDPITSSAASLWEKGKFRLAVSDASGKLNKLTQERTGIRDLSDYDLMAAAFNPKDPTKGRPRLRVPYSSNPDTRTSLQEGTHRIAMGVMLAIRNPAAHETGDGNPITCAEQLATLSMVARSVRTWYLKPYVEPIDTEQLSPAAQQTLAAWQPTAVQLPPYRRPALPKSTPTVAPKAD